MPNKVKLENPLYGVSLTLAERVVINETVTGGGANYVYTQSSALATWTVNHNLNKYCSVTVVDDNNEIIYGDVIYVDENNLIISFNAQITGKAYLN
jgi:hypothetical protein